MKELIEIQRTERLSINKIIIEQNNIIKINDIEYELVKNYRNAYKSKEISIRYSLIMTKYDYIVGDIASSQLRLKGFYKENNEDYNGFNVIEVIQDYLLEYVNFGAPYFILKKI